jgi:hypothetical protein
MQVQAVAVSEVRESYAAAEAQARLQTQVFTPASSNEHSNPITVLQSLLLEVENLKGQIISSSNQVCVPSLRH